MYNNFYVKYNYKNIIPFNFKKKKLRVQANIIANKVAQSFFVGHQVKFWYYFFGINGLKRDNTILVKRFLNKKLSVFFISKFNMIEGKWGFPKIYEKYYKKFSYLKNKKINLIKSSLLLNKDSSDYNVSAFTPNLSNFKIFSKNIFYLRYIYSINHIFYLTQNDNNFYNINLFKFRKNYKMPPLFIRTIKKRRRLKKDFDFSKKKKAYFRKEYKISINSQGLLNIYKRNNGLKKLINESYISLKTRNVKKNLLQWKWNIFMMRNINFKSNLRKNINNLDVKINNNITKHQAQQNRNRSQTSLKVISNSNVEKPAFDKKLYFKNKWFKEQKRLLEAEEFIKKKKKVLLKKQVLLKFIAVKKIMSVIRLIKLFKELKKNVNLGTLCYWFYKCFVNFKFNTFSRKIMFNVNKNKKIKKVKRYSLLLKKVNNKIMHNSRIKLMGTNKRQFAFLKFLKGKIKNKIKVSGIKSIFKKKKIIHNNFLISGENTNMDNVLVYRNKNIKFFSNKILEFSSVKKRKHKKILNWIIRLYSKLDKQFNIRIYMNFILNLKKKLITLYRNKLADNTYFNFDNNLFLTKTNVYYKFLGDIAHEYSNLSRVKRMNILKSKKRIISKKSPSFRKMHNFFKKRKKKFNIFSFLCRGHILLSGEDRILHKFQGSKFGKSLRKIWNTYLLKGKRLWSEDDFLIFTQNSSSKRLNRKKLNSKKIRKGLNRMVFPKGSIRRLQNRKWHRYMFNAGDLQNNFKISFLKHIKNLNNKKRQNFK